MVRTIFGLTTLGRENEICSLGLDSTITELFTIKPQVFLFSVTILT